VTKKTGRSGTARQLRPDDLVGGRFPQLSLQHARDRIGGLDETAASLGILLTRSALAHVQESEARVHRAAGWSWAGFRIMYIIWILGEVEARDLARISGVSRQSTSTVLATLESAGLVNRERASTEDKRLVAVRLTAEGNAAFESAFVGQNALDAQMFGVLSDDEKKTLQSLLQRVLDGMFSAIPEA
jgi:MarR family transcriptional regulator, organic hydroperoxide resistance regulator